MANFLSLKTYLNSLKNKIKSITNSNDSLSKKVVHGGFWVFTLSLTSKLMDFAKVLILVRILAPKDFGLFGAGLLIFSTIETFSQTGFEIALIQKKESILPYLDSAWTAQIIRGIIMALVLFIISPFSSCFFNEPRIPLILKVLALSPLINGFNNIGIIYFRKELEFYKQFFYEFIGIFLDMVVSLIIAYIYRTVWALIFGLLVRNIVNLIISYIVSKYKPKFKYDYDKMRELFSYGKVILFYNIITFLVLQGDDFFVSKYLGLATLGYYQLAYRISNYPATEISHVISQVTFPAFSKIQDSIPKLREALLQTISFTAFITIPFTGGIIFLAEDFVRIFLNEQWMPMVKPLQILALWGMIRSIMSIIVPVFNAIGKPKIMVKLITAQLFLMVCFIYPFTQKWGIIGTSIVVLFSSFLTQFIIGTYIIINIIKCSYWTFYKLIFYPFIATVIMLNGLLLIRQAWLTKICLQNFIAFIIFGVIIYGILGYIIDKIFNYGIVEVYKKRIHQI